MADVEHPGRAPGAMAGVPCCMWAAWHLRDRARAAGPKRSPRRLDQVALCGNWRPNRVRAPAGRQVARQDATAVSSRDDEDRVQCHGHRDARANPPYDQICAIAVALGRNAQNSIDTSPNPGHTVAGSVSCPLWSRGRANDLCWSGYECLKVRSNV